MFEPTVGLHLAFIVQRRYSAGVGGAANTGLIAGTQSIQAAVLVIFYSKVAFQKLPMAGLEPARALYGPTDFKSVASTISPHRRAPYMLSLLRKR